MREPLRIYLFGGPLHGETITVTNSVFESGEYRVHVHSSWCGYVLDRNPKIRTGVYRKKGRDNAAFEWEGFVE